MQWIETMIHKLTSHEVNVSGRNILYKDTNTVIELKFTLNSGSQKFHFRR